MGDRYLTRPHKNSTIFLIKSASMIYAQEERPQFIRMSYPISYSHYHYICHPLYWTMISCNATLDNPISAADVVMVKPIMMPCCPIASGGISK